MGHSDSKLGTVTTSHAFEFVVKRVTEQYIRLPTVLLWSAVFRASWFSLVWELLERGIILDFCDILVVATTRGSLNAKGASEIFSLFASRDMRAIPFQVPQYSRHHFSSSLLERCRGREQALLSFKVWRKHAQRNKLPPSVMWVSPSFGTYVRPFYRSLGWHQSDLLYFLTSLFSPKRWASRDFEANGRLLV